MSEQIPSDDADVVLLGSSELADAKRVKSLLEERGVTISLLSSPEACTSKSCKPKVEVFARREDLPMIQAFLQEQRTKVFDGLDVDHALLEEVYDPEKGEARCPACGTRFSTIHKECPDCGLAFG